MYKIITSAWDADDLSIGFDRNRERKRELTNNKTQKGKFHLRIHLEDTFRFAEHQEKATLGLAYRIILTKNTENSNFSKDNAMNKNKIKISAKEWYVTPVTASFSNQAILSEQILSKTLTELPYVERSVFMKEANTQNFWTFELGTQKRKTLLYCIFSTKR